MAITSMRIDSIILDKLRKYKIHPRETDNELLERMIADYQKLKSIQPIYAK